MKSCAYTCSKEVRFYPLSLCGYEGCRKVFDYVHKTSLRLMGSSCHGFNQSSNNMTKQYKDMIIYDNDPHQLCKSNVWCSQLNQNDEIKYNDQQR